MRVVWLASLLCLSFTTIADADPRAEYNASIGTHVRKFPPFAGGRKPTRDHGTTIVSFQLDRAGRIISSSIKETSGSEILDTEALATVLRAQPYPAAPNEVDSANFTMPFIFRNEAASSKSAAVVAAGEPQAQVKSERLPPSSQSTISPASPSYPERLAGAWGGRAEHAGDDRASVAAKACESYKRDPSAVFGDIIVFSGSEMRSYGGYSDYVDSNVSVRQIGTNQWQITDQHYQDEEGGRKAGFKIRTYTARVDGDVLTISERNRQARYNRCEKAKTDTARYIVPLQRGFYVKADTPCEGASRATLDLFLGNVFRFNCQVKSLQKLDGRYKIEQLCTEQDKKISYVSTYRLLSNTEYIVTSASVGDDTSQHYRYCAQSKLPEPWRSISLGP